MTYSELKKQLIKNGCYLFREGANHEIWLNPKTGEKFPVGRHGNEDVKTGTLNNILKAAGLK